MLNKAFTLVEILVTAIILGLVAFMVIPNFTQAINRSYAQDAMHNLMAIYAAQQYYSQNNGGSYCSAGRNPNCSSLGTINPTLNLNLSSTGGTNYDCSQTCAGAICCLATNTSITPNFTMQVVLGNAINTGAVPQYCQGTLNPCCQGGTGGNNCP